MMSSQNHVVLQEHWLVSSIDTTLGRVLYNYLIDTRTTFRCYRDTLLHYIMRVLLFKPYTIKIHCYYVVIIVL